MQSIIIAFIFNVFYRRKTFYNRHKYPLVSGGDIKFLEIALCPQAHSKKCSTDDASLCEHARGSSIDIINITGHQIM